MVQTAARKVKVLKNSGSALVFALGAEGKGALQRENPAAVEDDRRMAESLNNVTGKFGLRPERGWVLSLGTSEELER